MTYDSWIKATKRLNKDDRWKYANALDILFKWNTFKREFGWTGLKLLEDLLKD